MATMLPPPEVPTAPTANTAEEPAHGDDEEKLALRVQVADLREQVTVLQAYVEQLERRGLSNADADAAIDPTPVDAAEFSSLRYECRQCGERHLPPEGHTTSVECLECGRAACRDDDLGKGCWLFCEFPECRVIAHTDCAKQYRDEFYCTDHYEVMRKRRKAQMHSRPLRMRRAHAPK